MMMNACFASFNTKGFSSSLKNYSTTALPDETHLTYDGCFNELKYSIGPKAQKPMELHLGYARAQNQSSYFDSSINDYLTIFTKGQKDGEDRDDRILNSVLILDISGSMGGRLCSHKEGIRLQLAKEAILMFFSKLRPNDSFGLVLFDTVAQTLISVQRKSELSEEAVAQAIRQITTRGGTTLMTGFNQANQSLMEFLHKNDYVKPNSAENRLVMLTDVGDNSVATAKQFIEQVENSNIYTTIIGISDSFRSSVCECLNEVKGFNYFCATEVDDLRKYLFENFSFTFFPDTFDIEIGLQNQNTSSLEVYGTVDSDKVALYNQDSTDSFVVTKSKTSFPSELEIGMDGEVKTYGGLILVKLNLKNRESTSFKGKVTLKYRTANGQQIHEEYPVHYQSPINEQFYSNEALYEALSGFFYVYEVKNIIKKAKNQTETERHKYIEPLQKLRNIAPKSKLQELEDMIKKMKEHVKSVSEKHEQKQKAKLQAELS